MSQEALNMILSGIAAFGGLAAAVVGGVAVWLAIRHDRQRIREREVVGGASRGAKCFGGRTVEASPRPGCSETSTRGCFQTHSRRDASLFKTHGEFSDRVRTNQGKNISNTGYAEV